MIRPSHFNFNNETANSNHFQKEKSSEGVQSSQELAVAEFDAVVKLLREHQINVFVFTDTISPAKPDAIFPNNWVTFHHNGTAVLYPMAAENRRTERRPDIIEELKEKFAVNAIVDLTENEKSNRFLEGTGSIVFDHDFRFSYACISGRTNKDLFIEHSLQLGYHPICFSAVDSKGKDIYHTNVMMCVTASLAIVCLEAIKNPDERKMVSEVLAATGHDVIEISYSQMNAFAGNMIGLKTPDDKNLILMSDTAHRSLNDSQLTRIATSAQILQVSVPVIENTGGGGVRCMLSEIFLPPKN
jgi:hypothetical protein